MFHVNTLNYPPSNGAISPLKMSRIPKGKSLICLFPNHQASADLVSGRVLTANDSSIEMIIPSRRKQIENIWELGAKSSWALGRCYPSIYGIRFFYILPRIKLFFAIWGFVFPHILLPAPKHQISTKKTHSPNPSTLQPPTPPQHINPQSTHNPQRFLPPPRTRHLLLPWFWLQIHTHLIQQRSNQPTDTVGDDDRARKVGGFTVSPHF